MGTSDMYSQYTDGATNPHNVMYATPCYAAATPSAPFACGAESFRRQDMFPAAANTSTDFFSYHDKLYYPTAHPNQVFKTRGQFLNCRKSFILREKVSLFFVTDRKGAITALQFTIIIICYFLFYCVGVINTLITLYLFKLFAIVTTLSTCIN